MTNRALSDPAVAAGFAAFPEPACDGGGAILRIPRVLFGQAD